MDNTIIEFDKRPKLDSPVLIEGLPGVGNVGKLAAEHLIEELGAKEFARIYSRHFPPQVLIDGDGIARLVGNKLFYLKADTDARDDLIFLVGDYQGMTPEGQYELSSMILDTLDEFKGRRVYTLGGWGIGRVVKTPRVLGAATTPELVKEMKKHGVVFSKDEPGNGIVGASGLLLGLGAIRGMDGVCLMGETSGYFVDPNSARAVVEILGKIIKRDVNLKSLEERTKELDLVTSKLKDLDEVHEQKKDDLGYIA